MHMKCRLDGFEPLGCRLLDTVIMHGNAASGIRFAGQRTRSESERAETRMIEGAAAILGEPDLFRRGLLGERRHGWSGHRLPPADQMILRARRSANSGAP
jgi:hypothetical protein